jgi:hypothetical protein
MVMRLAEDNKHAVVLKEKIMRGLGTRWGDLGPIALHRSGALPNQTKLA